MACAISSLDDRSRERVEEARAKARPGLLTSIMHTHTASCVWGMSVWVCAVV